MPEGGLPDASEEYNLQWADHLLPLYGHAWYLWGYEGAEVSFVRSTMARFSGIYRLLDEH